MDLDAVLRAQFGGISRRQVFEQGGDDNLIERMVRRNIWKPLHIGVYLDHTGAPDQEQLRMAAVLNAWPAALAGESALVAQGVGNLVEGEVRVAIDRGRRIIAPTGVSIIRLKAFEERVLWHRTPPRLRIEDAALEVASRKWARNGEAAAVALLADLCQQRFSTPSRLSAQLESQPRLPGRSFLRALLGDVATGAYSLLEHRYLTKVERPHGLPRGQRQGRFAGPERSGYRDVRYPRQNVVIEPDGRLGHEFAADQWADLERDLLAATDDLISTRLGWGAVAQPCRLARLVGRLLQVRGWDGHVTRCPDCTGISGGLRRLTPGA